MNTAGGRESTNILAMPGQSRFEKELGDIFAASELVPVLGTGLSVSATNNAPTTRCARTGTCSNWTEDMA
ncbi:MAG: hypothetical protein KJ072_10925 [Verrucomicrobia bacterium]|nr:hypothetical protein [Verrucomicrobiota bacterium]